MTTGERSRTWMNEPKTEPTPKRHSRPESVARDDLGQRDSHARHWRAPIPRTTGWMPARPTGERFHTFEALPQVELVVFGAPRGCGGRLGGIRFAARTFLPDQASNTSATAGVYGLAVSPVILAAATLGEGAGCGWPGAPGPALREDDADPDATQRGCRGRWWIAVLAGRAAHPARPSRL